MLVRPLVYSLCLLVGALLAGVAAVLHPDLAGDGAAQLTTIAQCAGWRAIHWTFLFSFPLALTGLVGLARVHAKPTRPVRASGKLNRKVQWIARQPAHCAMVVSWAAPSPARSGC